MNKNKQSDLVAKICNQLGVPNLVDLLSHTPLRILQPILIESWRRRSSARNAADLLKEYKSKRQFYGVSGLKQNELHDFAKICQQAVPSEFEIVELSPIVPLGTNSVISKVSQNNSLPTIRGSEVVGDPTTQLALECASRREEMIAQGSSMLLKPVHLCSSQRVLRLQPFDSAKGYMQHFDLFALSSGGRGIQYEGFANKWIRIHIEILLEAIELLGNQGFDFSDITVKISDIKFLEQLIVSIGISRDVVVQHSLDEDFDLFNEYNIQFPKEIESVSGISTTDFTRCELNDKTQYFSHLEKDIIDPLRDRYPKTKFRFDFTRKAGIGYYQHLCFHIFATDRTGRIVQLADGGVVDWLQKLLGNKKEVMVTSGLGSELIVKLFSPKPARD